MWQNASNKGIKVKDKILSVNNIDVSDIDKITEENLSEINKLFASGKPIVLEINSQGNYVKLEQDLSLLGVDITPSNFNKYSN